MPEILSQIVKEALAVRDDDFLKIVDNSTQLICNEEREIGNFSVLGRLAKIRPHGEALVIGDLHGDLESLVDIMKESQFLRKMSRKNDSMLIFLGDYGDRGPLSAEVYYTILKVKILFPKQVVLMRGNHEGPEDLLPSPHDLPVQFEERFKSEGKEAYKRIRDLFDCLYTAALVENRYLMIHAGLPSEARSVDDLAYAHTTHPEKSLLEEMLWSDPSSNDDAIGPSPRGAGKLFGQNLTNRILKTMDVKVLIRGHESCEEGFRIDHDGQVLTLFSRKGPPYFNTHGAYLKVDLSSEYENAQQILPYLHKF